MHELSDRTRNEVREVSGPLLREAAFFALNCFPYETLKPLRPPQCGINKLAEKNCARLFLIITFFFAFTGWTSAAIIFQASAPRSPFRSV
jgi:hypothetical protein